METEKLGMKKIPTECNIEREAETNQLLRTKVQKRVNKELRLEETPKEPKEKTMVLD